MTMTPKERVYAAVQHREADRVPVGEAYVDYPVIEAVLGRPRPPAVAEGLPNKTGPR